MNFLPLRAWIFRIWQKYLEYYMHLCRIMETEEQDLYFTLLCTSIYCALLYDENFICYRKMLHERTVELRTSHEEEQSLQYCEALCPCYEGSLLRSVAQSTSPAEACTACTVMTAPSLSVRLLE